MSLLDITSNSNVKLLPLLADAFAYKPEDVEALADDLFKTAEETWLQTLAEMATRYGCGKTDKTPQLRGQDLAHLKQVALTDAQSIAQTWNNDVTSQLVKQFEENPRSNRFAYLERIEKWSEDRFKWKSKQTSIQIVQKARVYAQDRFRQENVTKALFYVYAGPAPVSDICKARTAAGVVDQAYADANPTPGHKGPCVHEWQEAGRPGINCSKMWLG